jgi:hypothetical protein
VSRPAWGQSRDTLVALALVVVQTAIQVVHAVAEHEGIGGILHLPWPLRRHSFTHRALVLGVSVHIEVALQSRDRYGRLLGSIWRDGQLVQEQLVRRLSRRAATGSESTSRLGRSWNPRGSTASSGRGRVGPERPVADSRQASPHRSQPLPTVGEPRHFPPDGSLERCPKCPS